MFGQPGDEAFDTGTQGRQAGLVGLQGFAIRVLYIGCPVWRSEFGQQPGLGFAPGAGARNDLQMAVFHGQNQISPLYGV